MAAVYGAVAFVVLQVADLVVEPLGLPPWTMTFAVFLGLVGFPIAVVLAWAFEATPEGVRRTPPADAEEIEGIVAQPARRRWPSAIAALGGMALLVGGWWLGRQSRPAAAGSKTTGPPDASIAVLPFADMSPAGDQEYFSEGISEELLNLLTTVPQLRVAARTSAFAFKGADLAVPVIADSLNVAHVLEGSVRKAGDDVRVTAQLIRAEDGFHVWSRTWDRTLEDIFAIQEEIAADVVDRLRITLLDEAPDVEQTDPDAYALVLEARHLGVRRTTESLSRAESLLREAIAIDPEYATAWSGLARVYATSLGVETNRSFEESLAGAREAAARAIAIDPDHASAHAVLGRAELASGNLAEAAEHYERALELAPGDARTVGGAAVLLLALGRREAGVRLLEYREARDPVSLPAHYNLGLGYGMVGRWTDAIESLRTAVALGPRAGSVRATLGWALIRAGRPEEALDTILAEPSDIWRLAQLPMAYHALGRSAESEAALAKLIGRYGDVAAFNIAQVLAFRGEVDRAFEWLDRAEALGDPGLSELLAWPAFEILEDDPRWDELLERIGRAPHDLERIEFQVDLPG